MANRSLEARMFAALSATNEAILRSTQQDELYQKVCDAAVHGGHFKITGALLPDADNALRIVAATSQDGVIPQPSISVDSNSERGHGLAGTAFRTGRSCFSNDVLNDERLIPWREDSKRDGVGATVAVPIRRGDAIVGVFLFCLAEAGSITEEIVALLERMVENVSFALDGFDRDEKKRLAELASARAMNIFKALSATNEAILRSASTTEMLRSVTEAAVSSGRLLGSAIFLKDRSSPDLVLKAAAGPYVHIIAEMRISTDETVPEGRGFAGIAFRSNAPCISNNVLSDERAVPWLGLVRRSGLTTCAVLPVTAGGAPTGVMYFFFKGDHGDLDDTMIELMSRIAANVSFGLDMFAKERARRRAERKQEDLHRMYVALSATNEAIMRAKTQEELLDLVCNAAVLGGRFTSTTIALAKPGEAFLDIAATQGRNADRVRSTRFSINADHPQGRGLTGTSFRTKRPCIVNDFLGHDGTSHWHAMARGGGTRSGASFPLLKGDEARGVILFLASEQHIFSEDMVELLTRLAENVSFALANFDRAEEKRRADKQIGFLATHDPLTGLPNRLMFNDLLEMSIKQASRYGRQFAVLFLDLDRFKIINDSLGHAAGDYVLVEATRRLKSSVRASDVVARLGGDEFVILLNEIGDKREIAAVASKILEAFEPTIVLNELECRATASIGIAHFPSDGSDAESLMKNADMAMYAAKDDGKNGFRFYSDRVKPPSVERLTLETHLRHALDAGQFSLHYQPKLDAVSGELTGAEALLRWRHPELGDLPPMKFIPLAEETGLIIPIGRWVLNTACRQNMEWQRQGRPPLSMAVNLSPRQFLDCNLLQHIDDALAASGMPAQLLQLEITESMVMQNVERAVTLLTEIRNRGIRLAIDDFGTGYSSMSLMKRFPIDTIKIDRSFVRDLAASPQDRAIAIAIIAMGRALGLTVVAEGVETVEQDSFLRTQMCDELQGFLFSKPLPPRDFAQLLESFRPAPLLQRVEAPPLAGDADIPAPDEGAPGAAAARGRRK